MVTSNYRQWLALYGGWSLVILFCVIPLVRWFTLDPFKDHFLSPYDTMSTIGKAAGIVGFMLYAMNFVLNTRGRWLEDLFGGLNRVFIAHHIVGALALIFLLFHPILMAVRMVDLQFPSTIRAAAEFLLPRPITWADGMAAFKLNMAYNDGIIAFTGLVSLLIITFFIKLPYHIWLLTHRFLGLAFAFAGLHILLMPTDLARDNFFRYYMLSWTLIGLGAFVYRTLLGNILVRRAAYVVSAVKQLPGKITQIELKPQGKPLSYMAGQFVFISFRNAAGQGISREPHPFSITSSSGEPVLRLNVKQSGDFTRQLPNLKPGTKARIEGAFGHFSYKRFGNRPQIWIAGGIGVTPFLGMARSYDEKSPPVTLIYSVVTKEELLERKMLKQHLPRKYKKFKFKPYVTSQEKGFLTAAAVEKLSAGVQDKEIFICGPVPMMNALRRQLKEMGVPGRRIHSEEFALS